MTVPSAVWQAEANSTTPAAAAHTRARQEQGSSLPPNAGTHDWHTGCHPQPIVPNAARCPNPISFPICDAAMQPWVQQATLNGAFLWQTILNLARAVSNGGRQLLQTTALGIVLIYVFAIVGFMYHPTKFQLRSFAQNIFVSARAKTAKVGGRQGWCVSDRQVLEPMAAAKNITALQ